MPSNKKQRHGKTTSPKQKGGSGSGYSNLWYARSPNNIQALSTYTVNRIEGSPMFNPLSYQSQVATPTSGVVPTGIHLGNTPAITGSFCVSQPLYMQGGGGECESTKNSWIEHVKHYALSHGISYGEALKSPKCRGEYYQ